DAVRAVQADTAQAQAVLKELQLGFAAACEGLPGGVAAIADLGAERAHVLRSMHDRDGAVVTATAALTVAVDQVGRASEREQQLRAELLSFEQAFAAAMVANQVVESDVVA